MSLPGWQLEALVPPAGVQKINVCFACSSLSSHELDTILSTSTVPLVWAESLWIAGKCWPKVAGFFANQAGSRAYERPDEVPLKYIHPLVVLSRAYDTSVYT